MDAFEAACILAATAYATKMIFEIYESLHWIMKVESEE